jgi:hypothetical protein
MGRGRCARDGLCRGRNVKLPAASTSSSKPPMSRHDLHVGGGRFVQLAGWRACACVVVVGSFLVSLVRGVCGMFVITRPCLFSYSNDELFFSLRHQHRSLSSVSCIHTTKYSRMFGPHQLVIGPQLFGFAAPLLYHSNLHTVSLSHRSQSPTHVTENNTGPPPKEDAKSWLLTPRRSSNQRKMWQDLSSPTMLCSSATLISRMATGR